MRFLSIVGARPQFIKLAPVSAALRQQHDEIIVHTGQHYDYRMSSAFFAELNIPQPDYNLEIGSDFHGAQTGRMLEAIERVLQEVGPDWVIVYGDTNSTLAGALAAVKLHLPLAHVEAGLRSFNRSMPEEINRIVTDHISDRLFCPTETARRQANSEGIERGIEVVGDVMYDVLRLVQPEIEARAEALLAQMEIELRGYLLVTVHRPVNTDDPEALGEIVQALNQLDLPIIFPVHPRTRACLDRHALALGKHIQCIEPLGYIDMLALESAAYRILTDSGGVQKEAFLLKVPCVTLREETEWQETVASGWNTLAGNRRVAIINAVGLPQPAPMQHNPFGNGDAALHIVRNLSH